MGAGLVLPESPVKSLGEAIAFFDTLRGRRLHNKIPAEAIGDLQPSEWFAKFVNDRTVDIHELAAATLLCASMPASAKVSLLFTWFDLDGDMQLSNFDLLHAYGAIRRGLAQLGVAPVLSEEELRTSMEREVCRMYLCYYKQVPPPTDHFSLADLLPGARWTRARAPCWSRRRSASRATSSRARRLPSRGRPLRRSGRRGWARRRRRRRAA
jgi:hypothetical protein